MAATRECVQEEFDLHEAEFPNLIRKIRSAYTILLQSLQRITNIGGPMFFTTTPDAITLHIAFLGISQLLITQG